MDDPRAAAPDLSVVDVGGLRIAHDDRVLEPRPWTALQSRWAAEVLEGAAPGPLLELCTGAGHIGLLAARLTGRRVVCVDVDPVAVGLAEANARSNGLGSLVETRCAPLQEALAPGERFALAIADPPWVSSADVATLPQDPVLAIDGGDDGLDLARACVVATRDHLDPGASLLVQLGDPAQADVLAAWAGADGWTGPEVRSGEGGVVLRLRHP